MNTLTRTFFLMGILLLPAGIAAQTDTASMDSDLLFSIAREKAFAGERAYARTLCRMILTKSPDYTDARVLLARTLAWDGQRPEARKEFETALLRSPSYKDAAIGLADLEFWDDHHARTIELVNLFTPLFPNDPDLLFRKARALHALGQDEESLRLLDVINDIDPSMTEAASLRRSIAQPALRFTAGADYTYEHYSRTYDPMKYAAFSLGFRSSAGSFIGRMNYADRFGSKGTQGEIDGYPRIADGIYAFVNYGYSGSSLFPRHRGGLEVFTRLPSSFEASLGFRHLYFRSGSSVTVYTIAGGWYYANYWFSIRPYLTPNGSGVSRSLSFTARRYFGNAEHFLGARVGAGFTPDERNIQSSSGMTGTEIFYLSSQSATMQWQYPVTSTALLVLSADYTHQELSFSPGSYVTVISAAAGVRVRL
jgi:YaiO family outer membrane protein